MMSRKTFLENLAEEFHAELDRCGLDMRDDLVYCAVSVYLKARVRKLETLETETSRERKKRLEKKRDQSRRYRVTARLRDVGSEVFGGHGDAIEVPDNPLLHRGSTVAQSTWSGLEERREQIEALAEKRQRNEKYR